MSLCRRGSLEGQGRGFVGCWGRFYPLRNYLQFQGLWAASKQPADKKRKAKAACWEAKRGRPIYWGPTEREAGEPGKASGGYGRTDCLIVATCGDFEDQVAIKQIGLGGNPFSFINCTLNCSASNIRGLQSRVSYLFGLPQLSLSWVYVLVVSIDHHITQTQKKRREKCGW